MKLISWNVNGIRAILKKGFLDFVEKFNPDVLCLQETKAHPEQLHLEMPAAYEGFWNWAKKKGYSGTAVFTKKNPLNVSYGIGMPEHDDEGRVITLEFPDYFLVNVYTPNAGEELKRLAYRIEWDRDFLKYVKHLEKKKPVIFCGDLNVAHKEIDLANPKSNRGHSGFTDEEREDFSKVLAAGFVDTFREVDPGPGKYTWWTYRFGARSRNIGWRIDYFCLSQALSSRMKDAAIHPEVMGSDHCPVSLTLQP